MGWELWALFASAFAAATLLPGTSEAALVAVQVSDSAPVWLALAVATAGNTLGSAVNWVMGRFALEFQDRKWFPVSRPQMERAQVWYNKYGVWSLFLSWVPLFGDPLTLVAGVMRTPIWIALPIVAISKFARYLLVVTAVDLF